MTTVDTGIGARLRDIAARINLTIEWIKDEDAKATDWGSSRDERDTARSNRATLELLLEDYFVAEAALEAEAQAELDERFTEEGQA